MKFSEFLRKQMSEPDGTPSNNRVMLFLFLSTVVGIIIGASVSPNFNVTIKIPEVPASFESLVEWVTGILASAGVGGKVATAVGKFADKGKEGEV